MLKDISLQIPKGQFVCVVGDVGSGKSSLLNAIIGDLMPMDKNSKPIELSGQIAYVQQSPWIQNLTVRKNILFGEEMDKELYSETMQACELL